MSDFNKKVIREFRTNDGKVGGRFKDMTLLLLHTRGAKTGQLRINPVATIQEGSVQVIAASKGGADVHPDWYYNLSANREVIIEIGKEKNLAWAEIVSEPERTELYAKLKKAYPGFADYETKTDRVIPVIKLSQI
jgi:deazaflavin-dependent oxidoreductase (nitroreductase family)